MYALYTARVNQEEDGHYTASFAPYDIVVDAGDPQNAAKAIRALIVEEGIKRGDLSGGDREDTGTGAPVYMMIDMDEENAHRHQTLVRKNITLPEWME